VTAARILLWRHGRTASNADGRFQGQLDIPLDDIGLEQAKRAAEAIADRIADLEERRIVSSDLSRAVATAQALAERLGVPVITDPLLREVNGGSWQGLLGSQIQAADPAEYAAWRARDDVRVGGAERRSEAGARAAGAIRDHAAAMDGGVLVVASHGAALRGATVDLLGLPRDAWVRFEGLRNAHWVQLTRHTRHGVDDGWMLTEYNAGV
jgi:probable phosphoglycerate mutase